MSRRFSVALQEHADDDLQVDGPGETDNEADAADDHVPPPSRTPSLLSKPTTAADQQPKESEQDTAQIAKKIKDLIHLKGAAKPGGSLPVKEEDQPVNELERSDSIDSLKKGSLSARSGSQGSLSGKIRRFFGSIEKLELFEFSRLRPALFLLLCIENNPLFQLIYYLTGSSIETSSMLTVGVILAHQSVSIMCHASSDSRSK